MKENELKQLIVGSKYHIFSLGSRDEPLETVGKFIGFSILGSSEALCVELDKSHKTLAGKTRMIPSHMVLALDVLTEAKEKSKSDDETTARSYL